MKPEYVKPIHNNIWPDDLTSEQFGERVNLHVLQKEREENVYFANTPHGRREVILTTINDTPVIGYEIVDFSSKKKKRFIATLTDLPRVQKEVPDFSRDIQTIFKGKIEE